MRGLLVGSVLFTGLVLTGSPAHASPTSAAMVAGTTRPAVSAVVSPTRSERSSLSRSLWSSAGPAGFSVTPLPGSCTSQDSVTSECTAPLLLALLQETRDQHLLLTVGLSILAALTAALVMLGVGRR